MGIGGVGNGEAWPTLLIRAYEPSDYEAVIGLYRQSGLYGGQFDENRDSPARLLAQIADFPDAILVALVGGDVVGTVSIIDDGRVAWLFRFAVDRIATECEVARRLYQEAVKVLAERGHEQVLVYAAADDNRLAERYDDLGMTRGGNYTCFWSDIGR